MTVVADLTNELNNLNGVALPQGAPGDIGLLAAEISREIRRLAQYPDPPPKELVDRVRDALLALRKLINLARIANGIKERISNEKQKAVQDSKRLEELAIEAEAAKIALQEAEESAREAAAAIANRPCPPPPGGMGLN